MYGSTTVISDFLGSAGGNGLDATWQVTQAGARGGGVVEVTTESVSLASGGSLQSNGAFGTRGCCILLHCVALTLPAPPAGVYDIRHVIVGGGGSGGTVILRVTNASGWGHDAVGGVLSATGGSSMSSATTPAGTGGAGSGGRVYIEVRHIYLQFNFSSFPVLPRSCK